MIRRDLVLASRRAASQLSLGARRRCRLALSSRRRTRGSVLVSLRQKRVE